MTHAGANTGRGYATALLSATILCTTSIFIRHLTQQYLLPPLILALWRDAFLVAALGLGLIAVRKTALLKISREALWYLAAYGAVLACYNGTLATSVAVNGAGPSTILVYTSAVFTAVLGWALFGERLGMRQAVAVALALVGCAMVALRPGYTLGQAGTGGTLIGLASGFIYAVYTLMGRKATTGGGLNPWTTLFYTFAFATTWLFLANVVSIAGITIAGAAQRWKDIFWLGRSLPGWLYLAFLGAGPSLGGFGMYSVTLSLLPSSTANLILTAEVPLTAVLAYLTIGERMSAIQLGGGLLIMATLFLLRRGEVEHGRLRKSGPVALRPGRTAH